ncbi:cupin domain-containing protein [Synechococcus sp. PCC 7336]|uniref:cupin domain-containing protein n=1 Tax=Synechococcus sp. PCC 7336 TaxID=195250 RepID=UPI000346CB2F|nr:cupin domain-containing protein [Synechococcus sp. PCC 7336]
MNKQELIGRLSLVEHIEGGYFVETYRSQQDISTERTGSNRSVMTSIYYLLTDDRPIDCLHKNRSDIMHYFHAGSPITYILLTPDGQFQKVKLGLDLANGEVPQLLVPGGYWKAATLEAGEFGLIGEAVAPGFDYRDMEVATSEAIRLEFPTFWGEVAPFIRK